MRVPLGRPGVASGRVRLPDWVAAPELAVLWERVRARLESTGLPPRGRVTVPVESRAERHAVGALHRLAEQVEARMREIKCSR